MHNNEDKYCEECGSKLVSYLEMSHGFDSKTGKRHVYEYYGCPKYVEGRRKQKTFFGSLISPFTTKSYYDHDHKMNWDFPTLFYEDMTPEEKRKIENV